MSKLPLVLILLFFHTATAAPRTNTATDLQRGLARPTKPFDLRRVINGQPCKIDDFPFLVQYIHNTKKKRYRCGGSLITHSWVLTAAHCRKSGDHVKSVLAIAGTTYAYGMVAEHEGVLRNVIKQIPHPDYVKKYRLISKNDIMVSRLESPMPTDNPLIKLVKLPSRSLTSEAKMVVVMGWGRQTPRPISEELLTGFPQYFKEMPLRTFANHTRDTRILMCAEIPIISGEKCQSKFPPAYSAELLPTNLCGVPYQGRDSCSGDSGGPLVYKDTVIGTVQSAFSCGHGAHTIYTRVDKYYDFMHKHIKSIVEPEDVDVETLKKKKKLHKPSSAIVDAKLNLLLVLGLVSWKMLELVREIQRYVAGKTI